MKTIKKKASLITALVTVASILSCSAISASAKTYTNGFYRGARYVSYVETDFTWTVDNRYNLTSSSASQWAEGLFTWCEGATRTNASSLEHDWNCRESIRVGVGRLSYNKYYSDNIALSNSGSAWIF